jgi:hypothetical protein
MSINNVGPQHEISQASCYFLSLRPTYFTQHLILVHPQPMFFPLITKHISVTVLRRVRIHSEKRLLTLSCSSVCLSARISTAPTGRILVNLILGAFTKICRETRNLFEIRQKYWVLYMNTSVYFTLLAAIYVVQQ